MGVRRAAIVHRYRIEAREGVGLAVGINFLEMPPKRFFSLVEAAADLEAGNTIRRPRMLGVGNKGIQRLVSVTALKGQMINSPPLQAGKRLHFLHKLGPFALRQEIEVRRVPTEDLSELEYQERPLRLGDSP